MTNGACSLCGAKKQEGTPTNYIQLSKYILITMIKKKGLHLKYGFTRSKLELVHILNRLDQGTDPETIMKEQRDALFVM